MTSAPSQQRRTPTWLTRLADSLRRRAGARSGPHAGTDTQAGHDPADVVRPISRERIAAYLDGFDFIYEYDEDGDLVGRWDGNTVWFLLLGEQHEIVQVRARWHRTLQSTAALAAIQAVNDWNRDRVWPKAYLSVREDAVAVYGEFSADLEFGVSDNQLDDYLGTALSACLQLCAALSSSVPVTLGDDEDDPDIPNE